MTNVVIVGGGIGGLATALLLGRQGRDVILCERDPAPVPQEPEEMWSAWPRPGTPQALLGHAFLPGFRRMLAERAPDVLERLLAVGAPLLDCTHDMPGRERRPEDAELTAIMCRRPVFEGILRQTLQAEPTVELRCGCDVLGLRAEPSGVAGVPRVSGVQMRGGDSLAATTVVLAGGRLLPVRRWIEAIDAQLPEEPSEGCGFVCFTRYFRVLLRPGEDHTISTQVTVEGDLGYMKYEIFGADRSTFCVELLPPVWDHELRALRHENVHTAVTQALPESREWLDIERATPIGPVVAMGQERSVLRHFVRDGRPVVLGLHAIGDARCQTNSLYAWGSAGALAGAIALADVLDEYAGDAEAQTLAFEARVGDEIAGRHEVSLARDRALGRACRGLVKWDDLDHGHGFLEGTVAAAADEDPEVFRAFTRRELQLDPVNALAENTIVLDRARALAAAREPERAAPAVPARETVLELIAAHGHGTAP